MAEKAAGAAGVAALILLAGTLGGMEKETIGLLEGLWVCLGCLGVLMLAAFWTGWTYPKRRKRHAARGEMPAARAKERRKTA